MIAETDLYWFLV